MANLSKSKLIAYRQCPKRLWLEIHRKELLQNSASAQASQNIGHEVGDAARRIYDPEGKGHFLDLGELGFGELLSRSVALARTADSPLFEAGFSANGALALADVMLPVITGGRRAWRMVEVKSSTSIKDYHRDDAAIQAYVARAAGVPLTAISLAHIDNSWVYPGDQDYRGLLVEQDLTEEAFARTAEVERWIAEAQCVAGQEKEPEAPAGTRCDKPYACGFIDYCHAPNALPEHPAAWLPNVQSKALIARLADGAVDMRDVPDELLNAKQLRVKSCTLRNEVYFDAQGAAQDLSSHPFPACFLDFETAMFAVPLWKGTRPYQQIPFQFSQHRLSPAGDLIHQEFLDLSGGDPSRRFAESLVNACGVAGTVYVYNARFERTRIKELAGRFPDLAAALLAINDRIFDLLDVAQVRYYHPSQQGSWSIKKVLPAIAPGISYDQLGGIQDGGMAMEAFKEAIDQACPPERKTEIERQLRRYCSLDTLAMVKIWEYFGQQCKHN